MTASVPAPDTFLTESVESTEAMGGPSLIQMTLSAPATRPISRPGSTYFFAACNNGIADHARFSIAEADTLHVRSRCGHRFALHLTVMPPDMVVSLA